MHYPKGKLSLEFVHNGRYLPRGPPHMQWALQSTVVCPAGTSPATHSASAATGDIDARTSALRARSTDPVLLFPDELCHFTSVLHGGWLRGGDGNGRKRGCFGSGCVPGAEYPHAAGRWYRCNRPFDQTWYLVKFMPRAGVRLLPRCDLHEASVH